MNPFHWSLLLVIGAGGALGAIARYSLVHITAPLSRNHFPLGTFLANLTGSFLIGLAFVFFFLKYPNIFPHWRSQIMVGFLGAFTTFSTFALESWTLYLQGQLGMAIGYAIASVVGCVMAVAAGYGIAKLFI